MKNAFKLLTIFYLLAESFGLTAQEVPEALTGVWKYEIPGLEGIGIFSPTHAAMGSTENG